MYMNISYGMVHDLVRFIENTLDLQPGQKFYLTTTLRMPPTSEGGQWKELPCCTDCLMNVEELFELMARDPDHYDPELSRLLTHPESVKPVPYMTQEEWDLCKSMGVTYMKYPSDADNISLFAKGELLATVSPHLFPSVGKGQEFQTKVLSL